LTRQSPTLTPAAGPPERRRRDPAAPGDRRRQILAAATKVFARQGFDATRVADIATEAGVAYGLVYHYFSHKDEVLDAILAECWALIERVIGEVAQSGTPLPDQLRNVAGFVLEGQLLDPDRVAVVLVEGLRGPRFHAPCQIEAFRRIQDSLCLLLTSSGAPLAAPARTLALHLLGALEVLLVAVRAGLLPGDADSVPQHRDHLVNTFLHGALRPGAHDGLQPE
jgi:TetR/AcrR family fatty acid metabolism transcriptional regulator